MRRATVLLFALAFAGVANAAGPGPWTGKARRFGGSMTAAKGVVYQPDVVVIGGGASAIRSASVDALTWTLRGDAPGVYDLRVGKIMLATTFASGRVLSLKRAGRDVEVVLGPVSLTDVVRDGTFESSAPVPLAHLIVTTTTYTKPAKRTTQGVPAQSPFKTYPICCDGGVGVHFFYDNGGTGRLSATVSLHVERPTVSFRLKIGLGRIEDAYFQLHGAGGLHYDLHGVTRDVSGNVKSGPVWVPGSVTIPLGGPLAITLTQAFDVTMQLAGATDFRAAGDYNLSGDLGFGIRHGRAVADAVAMSDHKALVRDTHSVSLGVSNVTLGWSVRATVGIGLAGFSAGAWYELRPGMSLTFNGSPMSLRQGCATESLDVTDRYGVGYSIPNFVAGIVNSILSLARVKPIKASGGPSWGPYRIWQEPETQYCIPHTPPGSGG